MGEAAFQSNVICKNRQRPDRAPRATLRFTPKRRDWWRRESMGGMNRLLGR